MDRNEFREALNNLHDIRTANALDWPVAQVRVINRIERNHGEIEVELVNGYVEVTYRDADDFPWSVYVGSDGSLDYTLGGALPELRRFNSTPA